MRTASASIDSYRGNAVAGWGAHRVAARTICPRDERGCDRPPSALTRTSLSYDPPERMGTKRSPRLSRSDPNWDPIHRPYLVYRANPDHQTRTLIRRFQVRFLAGASSRKACVPPHALTAPSGTDRRPVLDRPERVGDDGSRPERRSSRPESTPLSSPARVHSGSSQRSPKPAAARSESGRSKRCSRSPVRPTTSGCGSSARAG